MRSVPPCGSGWVSLCNFLDSSSAHCRLRGGPTRYRTVVLTSWDRGMSDCERGPTRYRECVRTQRSDSERQNSAQYRTASVATGCRHSTQNRCNCATPKAMRELNGGIRSLRSRFCSECFDHDQFEFSHSLYREVVLTSWDRVMSDGERGPDPLPRGGTDLMGPSQA